MQGVHLIPYVLHNPGLQFCVMTTPMFMLLIAFVPIGSDRLV